ncbi:hypothetical protein Hbal_0938 [Hirschia baltica ATCC 49814]|uniref:Uncharacterized protein n=2 Tax=Hirschia TaxID=2723 RepID=C6XQM6_HIRBI|nr:hypothetical protein Hbal_0938 [Hirschia baltica ATCC 49814]
MFSIYLVIFALTDITLLPLGTEAAGMFAVAIVCLIYLSLQSGMAAYSSVGNDRPIFDFFFSLAPLFTLLMIAVLSVVGATTLSTFESLSMWLAFAITMMDVVFNTQVIFKMNRLATDMVQMR